MSFACCSQLESVFSARAKEQQGKRTDLLATLPKSKPINTRKELAKIDSSQHFPRHKNHHFSK